MLREFFDNVLYKFGYVSERELTLRALPAEKQRKAREILKRLNEPATRANIGETFTLYSELGHVFRESAPLVKTGRKDAVRLIGGDIYGYRPAMARLYGLFQNNPFGIYSFVARHHWAVRAALQVIRDEMVNDGFELRGQKGTTKKRLRDVYRQLKALKIFELRIDIACHIKLFGNAWILPHKNLLGGPGGLELLAPPRLMPIIDPVTDQILGWEYSVGRTSVVYPKEKLFQIYQYTVDNYKEIGDPPLQAAILQIEADLSADSYNNQVFQRGGMMGYIVNVKSNSDDPIARDEEDILDDLQDRIDTQYSGVKAAHSLMVTNNVDQVFPINSIGKLEASYQNMHMECAKTIANCLGVPPEKISVSRSQNLQYIPSVVEDTINSSFDKSLNALTSLVDEFINDKILVDMLGITDVRIVASGRYGALTLNAAKTIESLSNAGPILTVNWALERVLGWEPLPGDNPRGQWVLDNSVNRTPEITPMHVDPAEEDPNFGKSIIERLMWEQRNPRTRSEETGYKSQKKMTSEQFFKMTESIRSGTFERVDKTHAADSEYCTVLKFKRGDIKFYDDIHS